MIALIARRLLQSVPLALAVVSLGFLLIHLAPGDTVLALSGEFAHEEVQRELRERYGLDRGLSSQYLIYLQRTLTGELGTSFYFQEPVGRVILERLPATLLLVVPSLLLSTGLGVLGGALLAGRTRRRRARGFVAVAVASNAVPVFWLAQLLLLVFAVQLGLFPVQGMIDARTQPDGLRGLADLGRHLVLPVAAMTLHQLALIVVLTWINLERELEREYVRAAAARGLERRRVRRHALRNAILPVITAVGGRIGSVFSGAVLTETVFAWPGLGRLAVLGTTNRDFPLVLGLFFFMTFAVLLANLLTDIVTALVDPRIRLQ